MYGEKECDSDNVSCRSQINKYRIVFVFTWTEFGFKPSLLKPQGSDPFFPLSAITVLLYKACLHVFRLHTHAKGQSIKKVLIYWKRTYVQASKLAA